MWFRQAVASGIPEPLTPTLWIKTQVWFRQDVLSGIPENFTPELIYRCDFIRLCYQESQGSLQHCCGINYKLVSSGCVIWHWNPRARSLHPSRGITYRCDCDKIHSTTWIYTKDISPTMIVSSAYWWWETWSLIEELGKRISSLGDDNSKCKKNEICLATEYHRLQIFQIQIAELTLCDCRAA